MHWFCLECWSELGEDAVICPACGASVKEARGRNYVQKLIAALRHPVGETAEFAAQILGELEAQEAVPVLIETLGRSGEPYLQAAAARSLGDLQAAEAVPALCEVLRSSYLVARIAAARALGRIATSEAVAALEEARQDRTESVRRAVEEQLARRAAVSGPDGRKLVRDDGGY